MLEFQMQAFGIEVRGRDRHRTGAVRRCPCFAFLVSGSFLVGFCSAFFLVVFHRASLVSWLEILRRVVFQSVSGQGFRLLSALRARGLRLSFKLKGSSSLLWQRGAQKGCSDRLNSQSKSRNPTDAKLGTQHTAETLNTMKPHTNFKTL